MTLAVWWRTRPVVKLLCLALLAASMRVRAESIPLKVDGGTFTVPISINDRLTLDFTLDTGASDVSLPADVVSTLIRTGTISDADFLGNQTYILADGSRVPSRVIRLRSLRVGTTVLRDVQASVAPERGTLLLGQSFLRRLPSWSIDNKQSVLIIGDQVVPSAPPAPQGSVEASVADATLHAAERAYLQKDYKTAARLYLRVAEGTAGNTGFANNVLASMYERGIGVPRDDAKAFSAYLKAAHGGYADAAANLGLCYAEGRGTPRDDRRAYVWLSMVSNLAGDSWSGVNRDLSSRVSKDLDLVITRLDPQDAQSAETALRECRSAGFHNCNP